MQGPGFSRLTLSLLLSLFCCIAYAQDDSTVGGGILGGSVTLGTDYVFRSLSISNEKPQIKGDFNWTHDSGLYVGVWSSNTDFGGPGNSMELDPYIGFSGTLHDSAWSYDTGFWYYHFPGSQSDLDYWEVYGTLTYILDNLSISGSLWYADNYFGDDFFGDESSLSYHAILAYQLPGGLRLSARLGEQTFDEPAGLSDQDYLYYDIGVTKDYQGFSLELRWHDSDGVKPALVDPDLADARLVAGITKSF